MITLALSKGRIFTETLPFLAAAGIYPLEDPETSRKLIIGTNNPDLRIVVVRASDVPTYVQYGAADMGVARQGLLVRTRRRRSLCTFGPQYRQMAHVRSLSPRF